MAVQGAVWSQGVQLETLKALATYWASGYDRRRVAARLNELGGAAALLQRDAVFRPLR
jgi:hypothetical protein